MNLIFFLLTKPEQRRFPSGELIVLSCMQIAMINDLDGGMLSSFNKKEFPEILIFAKFI